MLKRSALFFVATLVVGCPEVGTEHQVSKQPGSKKGSKIEGLSQKQSEALVILATADVGSDTDVCGCKARRMGGVARRAHVIAEAVAAHPGRTLVLDAGDLFFRTWSVSPRYEAQAKATAEFHADVLAALDVPAIAVGERDLAMGRPKLLELGRRAGTELLSANLVHAGSGTAAFDRFALVSRGNLKIGIVGASPELGPKAQAVEVYRRAKLETIPPGPALQSAARDATQAGADVVVALLHIGDRRAKEVLSTLPSGLIDVAIVGHDRTTSALVLTPNGGSAFMAAGARGKWVASFTLDVVPNAKGIVDVGAIAAHRKALRQIDERIESHRAQPQPDGGAKLVTALERDRQATLARLQNRKKKMLLELETVSSADRHRISAALVPLDVDRAQDPAILALYRAYQDRLHKVNRGVAAANRAELSYTGSEGCRECHAPAFKFWKKTKHAAAWATMVRTRQTANLDCIPCHVTGFDRRGGPGRLRDLQGFRDVGCESCHGPGSAHAKNPKVALDYGLTVPERVCAECHRAQEDQKPFVFEDRLPKVVGPGHRRKR